VAPTNNALLHNINDNLNLPPLIFHWPVLKIDVEYASELNL
jgi:hypothetical protein